MVRSDLLKASISRIVVDDVEDALRSAFLEVDSDYAGKGRSGGGSHRIAKRRHLTVRFKAICEAAACRLVEIEGQDAFDHAPMLNQALRDAQNQIQNGFDETCWMPNVRGDSIESPKLSAELDQVREGTIDHLRLGIAGGKNLNPKTNIHIDNRGGAGQFAIGDGNIQEGGHTVGADAHAILQALVDLQERAQSAGLDQEQRQLLEDAIASARRAALSEEKDGAKLRRLCGTVLQLAREFGVGYGASIVAALSLSSTAI